MTRRYTLYGNEYMFSCDAKDNNHITLTRNGKSKTVKVIDQPEYVYKVNKKSIAARDGAAGLYNWLDDRFYSDFAVSLATKLYDLVFERF